MRRFFLNIISFSFGFLLAASDSFPQTVTNSAAFRPELLYRPKGNFVETIARPLRYWPINGDFVITNGAEVFNRPLYAMNTSFRIDGATGNDRAAGSPARGVILGQRSRK